MKQNSIVWLGAGAVSLSLILAALPPGANAHPMAAPARSAPRGAGAPARFAAQRSRTTTATPAPCFTNYPTESFDAIPGQSNVAGGQDSAVLAGFGNEACGGFSAIGAGFLNNTSGAGSFIGGGDDRVYLDARTLGNSVSASDAFVGAGDANVVTGAGSFIGAGGIEFEAGTPGTVPGNSISGTDSFVGAGDQNSVGAIQSFIGTGTSDSVAKGADDSFVGAGSGNAMSGAVSFIGAGSQNQVSGSEAFAGAGLENQIVASEAFIGAGHLNYAAGAGSFVGAGGATSRGSLAFGTDAFIGAGDVNTANGSESFIGGGDTNDTGSAASYSSVAGGARNTANGEYATIAGGFGNVATGAYADIPGGDGNTATGTLSFAGGYHADATHDGSFVWSDYSSGSALAKDSAANQFVVRASGGVSLSSNEAQTSGVRLAAGSGSWASLSDRNAKTDIVPLDDASILAKVVALPVSAWRYKSESGVRHVGPMAQDFYAAFGVGEDDRHITSIDEDGIALAAIKALHARLDAKDAQIAALSAGMRRLNATVATLVRSREDRARCRTHACRL